MGRLHFQNAAPDIKHEASCEVLDAKLRSAAWKPPERPDGRQLVKSGPVRVMGAALLAVLIGFIPYRPVLGYFFTGTDTLTLIETSRVESSEDVEKILVKPLMWGSDFTERARFYRPIAAFSYSLDYLLWRLNPFGYHLTNLGLHLLVIVLILLVVLELTNQDLMAGFVSAVIFGLHPILTETVPAPDHRHDILAGCFLLLSLLLYVKSRRNRTNEKTFIALSVMSYFLALGAKEIAVVLPAIIFSYLMLFSQASSLKSRFAHGVKGAAVYLLATSAYLLWRVHVLGGLGGYGEADIGLSEILSRTHHFIVSYAADLLYPHDILAIFDTVPRELVVAFLLAFLGLWLINCTERFPESPLTGTIALDRRLALFVACWLVIPLGVFIVSLTFNHRSMYTCAIPYSILIGLLLVLSARRLKRLFHADRLGSATKNQPNALDCSYSERDAMHSYRAQAGEKCSKQFSGCAMSCGNRSTKLSSFGRIRKNWSLLAIALLGVGLISGHLLCSPLVHRYDHWDDCSRMTRFLLSKLSTLARTFTIDATIQVQNLPSFITRYELQIPRAREVGYLNDYSIKSWLNLCCPGNRMKVVVLSRFSPAIAPVHMHLQVRSEARNAVRLCIGFPGTKGRCFPPLK